MNKIERLIERLCPSGVEWKTLGEVATIERGVRVVRKQLNEESGYPVYQNSLKSMGFYCESNRRANLTFVICAGAAGEIGFSDVDFWSADDCYTVDGNGLLLDRYIYHFLLMSVSYLKSQVRKASIPRLSRKVIDSLSIPVPPLEIQSEIVQVLDNFAKLTAELTAELAKRKKQYEHYRDTLLSGDWPRVKLGEVCEIKAGGDVPESCVKGQMKPSLERPYPVYSNGIGEKALYGYAADYRIAEDSVSVSARGTIGYHSWRAGRYTGIVRLITLIPGEVLSAKYLDYALSQVEFKSAGGGIPQLTVPMVRDEEIPLPPLAEQERIVAILDKFDKLVNSLTEGLPAEIAGREKQYAYYRDRLLSFGKGI